MSAADHQRRLEEHRRANAEVERSAEATQERLAESAYRVDRIATRIMRQIDRLAARTRHR